MRRLAQRANVSGSGGFTLAELLITMAIVGIVLAGLFTFLRTGESQLQMGAGQVEAQQNVRVAFDLMIKEIRGAGFDPRSVGFAAIVNTAGAGLPTATGLRLQNDLNGNGVFDAGERVQYAIVGTLLRRQVLNAAGGGQQDDVIIAGVDTSAGAVFQYENGTGAAPANETEIRTVVVLLQTRPEVSAATGADHGLVFVRMTDAVQLRNTN